jgi:hypothetical protein
VIGGLKLANASGDRHGYPPCVLLGILVGLFFVAVAGGMLYAGLRPAAAIWRGDADRVPHLGQISVNARSYLAFLLWFVPCFLGLGLIGITAVAWSVGGSRSAVPALPAYVVIVLMIACTPLIAMQWFVSAFARPKFMIPPPYRQQRGSFAEARERRRRRRSGLPPTDHLVEILDVRPLKAGDFEPYLIALCSEPECDWLEFADLKLIGPSEEEQLRTKAATHSTATAPCLQRPLG